MNAVLKLEFEFVPMRPEDLDAVVAAEQRILAFPWTRGNFADSLAAGYSAWIMRQDGAMVGYGVVMMAPDEAHLLNISILPELQRRGLGRNLLDHFCNVARESGARRMLLEVRRSNVTARAFYDRLGFAAIGERLGYYEAPGGREGAVVMALDL
jgi:[ribosomal protein S18]-alanine N-acetyltransferase